MRLLVVVSSDYGELGGALYFLQGLAAPERAVLLLPAPLAAAVGALPGVDARSYARLDDIRAQVLAVQPDVVLLASGYLLAINSVLRFRDAVRLIRFLRRRGVTLLTSDPFLGLVRSPRAIDFRSLAERQGEKLPLARAVRRRLVHALFATVVFGHLALLERELRPAWHVYFAPLERLPPRPGIRRLAYFNPDPPPAPAAPAAPAGRPLWLFILSAVDFEVNAGERPERFAARIAARVGDGIALDRDVVVIAPPAGVDALRAQLAGRPRVTLLVGTPYVDYARHLAAAEYAFFWNYLSFSVLHRVLADQPVFFFGAGHLAHFIPRIGEEGVRLFYGGWRPPLLALDAALDAQDLARRAQETRREFGRIRDRLGRSPSSQAVLAEAARAR